VSRAVEGQGGWKRGGCIIQYTTNKGGFWKKTSSRRYREFSFSRGRGNESLEGVVVLQQRRKHQAAYGSKSGRRDNKMPYQRNERASD